MSPKRIQPFFLMNSEMARVNIAGRMKCITRILMSVTAGPSMGAMTCQVMIWPTRPQVPIPDPDALLCMFIAMVPTGPKIALESMAGIQIMGRRMMLGTWSMEVPSPCAKSPPALFSRQLATAKPTICLLYTSDAADER